MRDAKYLTPRAAVASVEIRPAYQASEVQEGLQALVTMSGAARRSTVRWRLWPRRRKVFVMIDLLS
jgi:hypothetical protein